ncbi:MAG TPA: 2-oxoacid:ferredoxin oxidoreductase subunit beta [Candidatus Cloacimonetes bacterium]|nr:2-oxoacid:ferredoxin oxidoreductase subunit beta [Candidatus Cloacimonadota bacterium]
MNPIITAFANGIKKSGIELSKIVVVSDIPFDPEIIKELGIDFFHTTRGRAIAFGTGLKLGNPELKVVAFIGDLMTIGGNHLVHSGRRNMEMLVICVNNFVYKEIAGTPSPSVTTGFSAFSTFEKPFNAPHLANSCGAVFTARWTALHTNDLTNSIAYALPKPGFSVIEVLSPGPNFYQDINKIESELLNFYFQNSITKNKEDTRNVEITADEKIITGEFTDKKKTTFIDSYNAQLGKILGDKFIPLGGQNE